MHKELKIGEWHFNKLHETENAARKREKVISRVLDGVDQQIREFIKRCEMNIEPFLLYLTYLYNK